MIVSATILLLIISLFFASMLISLPVVQNRAVQYATTLLSEKLGSEVSIRRIDLTMMGYLELDDLLVRDLGADTLLYTKSLKTRLKGFSRDENTLSLGRSTIDGAVLNLQEMENGEMNIREIVLKLTTQEINRQALIIEVSEIEIDDLDLKIARREHLNPVYGVDMRNIVIHDMAAKVKDLMVDGPAIHAQIETMSGVEQSGFEVVDMGGELYISSGAIAISDMKFDSRWSSLKLDYLTIADKDWGAYRDFNTSTELAFEVSDGQLSSDDVAYFAPSLRNWGVMLEELDFSFRGEVNSFELDLKNLLYGEDTRLSALVECRGITSPLSAKGEFKLHGLTTNARDIEQLAASVASTQLSPNNISQLTALGEIILRGEAKGGYSKLDVDASLESDAAMAHTTMTISQSDTTQMHLIADLDLYHAQLGKIMSNPDLGDATLRTSLSGYVAEPVRDLSLSGEIESMQWREYPLHSISFDSHISADNIGGEINCMDPKLQFLLTGRAQELKSEDRQYQATMDLKFADLKALNINRRDTTSRLSALVKLSAHGNDIENGAATVVMERGEYLYNSKKIESQNAILAIDSNSKNKSIELTSEFVDGSFRSPNSVKHIVEYLRGAMAAYLPSLYAAPHEMKYNMSSMLSDESLAERKESATEIGLDTSQFSHLDISAHNLSPITEAISEGLQLGGGTHATLDFNVPRQLFDLKFRSGYLERNSLLAIGIDMQATNRGDSVALLSNVEELFVGTNYMQDANLKASARNNTIDLNAGFKNKDKESSADIGAVVNFSRSAMGRQDISARLLPSSLHRRGEEWRVGAEGVDVNERGIDIRKFRMESRDQLLTIDGVASRSLQDTVRMNMHNFDLSILSSVIAQLGYYIEGETNGTLVASSLLENARLEANVALDSIKVNTIPAPAMDMSVDWDFQLNRARLFLSDRVNRDTLIRGYYIPSEVKYFARLEVDSVNMGLLDPPLGGVITQTRGLADLNLTLQGERRNADLTGTIDVSDLSTKVAYTNVRYEVPKATVVVTNNLLSGHNAIMYDKKGGSGLLDLTVDLQHLSNIKYDLKIAPRSMLVLDTSERDNDLFYGDLYASGAATISGDKSGVKMNITATSAGDSHFFMPLSNKSTISTADFITFATPVVKDSADLIAQRRQLFEKKSKGKSNGSSISINMALDVKPNTELQLVIDPTVGDIIKARGEGKMNLKIEPQSNIFEIYGDYTIDEGSYLFTLQNIVNKRFVIDPGSSIQWTGSPTDARLDINAIYKLKTSLQPIMVDESSRSVPVDCIIHLGDRLTHPDVSFDIELPASDPEQQAALRNLLNDQESISRQFFYLMLANSFIPESQGMTSDFGVSTTAATGFELLTNQLSNWLSSSNYNIIIRYRPESELTGEEVDFGFSKGIINNRVLVELEGNYIIDNKQAFSENASNFMGEAYITWLIDRAGALRLKGFTQTIDRYDENQGLQETGVGIYYRENFDNFRDLQERVRARFSRKKKTENNKTK